MSANKLSGIVMRVMITLLCLALFSSHLASGMFARYTVTGEEDGSAVAAKYDVKIIPLDEGDPLAVDVNGDVSYQFKVDNSNSEVAVKYDIYVSFSDCYDGDVKLADVEGTNRNLRLNGYTFNNYSVEYQDEAHQDIRNYIFKFEVKRMLRPGSTSRPFTLTFNTSPSWTDEVRAGEAPDTIRIDQRYRYPVRVFVDAEQLN